MTSYALAPCLLAVAGALTLAAPRPFAPPYLGEAAPAVLGPYLDNAVSIAARKAVGLSDDPPTVRFRKWLPGRG